MFYNFLYPLADQFSLFNLFQYVTVRCGGALGTSFLLTLLIGPFMIAKFRVWQSQSQTVRTDHPEHSVSSKAGTPTMGGVMVMGTLLLSMLLWSNLFNPYVWILIGVTASFFAIGFADDILTMRSKNKKGLSGKLRLFVETVTCVIALYACVKIGGPGSTDVYMPFFKDAVLHLGLISFIVFGVLVIVGSANAVNLTDGLDGLVSVPVVVTAGSFAAVAYIVGRADFTEYLNIAHVPGASDVAVFCSALAGSVLGFLWFNAPPARIFMGDTGSLPIGASLGIVSVILKQEFMLLIIGGIFVLETVSVIVQVASFKLTGKRVFRMAPLHHHFEHKGWPESTIVVRFWIISIILAIIGLATLKLR